MPRPPFTVFHIPVCPFSQRVEILLTLKGRRHDVRFEVVDVTKPRDPSLLAKTHGSTALPVLELEDGRIIRESLIILQFFEETFGERPVTERDPWRRAVASMLVTEEREFVNVGYGFVLNQDPAKRGPLRKRLLDSYARIDAILAQHSPNGTFLFDEFALPEVVFTPMFVRFWFLEYYEGFVLPDEERYARVKRWREACLAHPAAQQVTREEVVKSYYDYAKGAGNGELLPGRKKSSFAFEPHWSKRPWPPADKYGVTATDAALGL